MNDGIVVQEVSKHFLARSVLSRVSCSIARGKITWLSGANGSGKSTLLRMLSGLLRPDEGQIFYGGAAVVDASSRESILPKIGTVLQNDMLYGELTVAENLRVFSRLARDTRDVREFVTNLGLEEHLNSKIRECSQGVRRKASLLRALVGSPRYLFLDEIFSHLDSASTQATASILQDVVKDGAVVVISGHETELLQNLCADRIEVANGCLTLREVR